jgi:hypothetical protein
MSRLFVASSNQYLDAGTVLSFDGTDQLTLATWICKRSTNGEGRVIAKWTAGSWQYLLAITGSKTMLALYIGGGTYVVTGSTTLQQDIWYHIAGTYDGSVIRVHVDGVQDGFKNQSGNLGALNPALRIGIGSGTESPFDGCIGHPAIWDVGLSANEIASLAAGISPLQIRRDNLVAYWPLNGQSPELDVVGRLDMTLFNSPTVAEEPPIPHSIVAP